MHSKSLGYPSSSSFDRSRSPGNHWNGRDEEISGKTESDRCSPFRRFCSWSLRSDLTLRGCLQKIGMSHNATIPAIIPSRKRSKRPACKWWDYIFGYQHERCFQFDSFPVSRFQCQLMLNRQRVGTGRFGERLGFFSTSMLWEKSSCSYSIEAATAKQVIFLQKPALPFSIVYCPRCAVIFR